MHIVTIEFCIVHKSHVGRKQGEGREIGKGVGKDWGGGGGDTAYHAAVSPQLTLCLTPLQFIDPLPLLFHERKDTHLAGGTLP